MCFISSSDVGERQSEEDDIGDEAKEEESPPSSPILVAPKQLHPTEKGGTDSEFSYLVIINVYCNIHVHLVNGFLRTL